MGGKREWKKKIIKILETKTTEILETKIQEVLEMNVQETIKILETKALEVIEKLVNLNILEVTTNVTSIFLLKDVFHILSLTFPLLNECIFVLLKYRCGQVALELF